jgi:transposase
VKAEKIVSSVVKNGAMHDGGFPRVAADLDASNPEVIPGASEFGNRYSLEFKLKVLRESDACVNPGDIGRYLRQTGITHTTLTCFRKQRASGVLDAPGKSISAAPQGGAVKSAKQAVQKNPDQTRKVLELERENRKLKHRLEQAEAIIDIQKKVSRLLESSLDPSDR